MSDILTKGAPAASRMGSLKKCWAVLAAAGVVELLKVAALPPELAALGAVASPVVDPTLNVLGNIFPNLASARIDEAATEAYAVRNHHLRMGIAESLRRALARATPRHPNYAEYFAHWDDNLERASDRNHLDRLIPDSFESVLFDAGSGAPTPDETAPALGALLYNYLTTDPSLAAGWTPEDAAALSRHLLSPYFDAFKQLAINDTQGHLFQAFTVNGLNRLLILVQSEGDKTRQHITDELDRRLPFGPSASPAVPQDWRPPALFLGRDDELQSLSSLLLGANPSSVFVASIQGLPGVGKSLLCEQFAASHPNQFPGGYARLTLDPEATLAGGQLLAQLAERFAIKAPSAQLASALRARLLEPRSLVHIENVDSDDAAHAVAELARSIPGCALLVSGRRGGLGQSQNWSQLLVEPFGEALALAQLEAELGRPPRNEAELREWRELLKRCGYLPLAIHLSAGQMQEGFTVPEILAELLHLAPVDPADPLYEQRARACIRTSFEISWRLFEREQPESPAALSAFSAAPLSGVAWDLGSAITGQSPVEFRKTMNAAAGLSLVVREKSEPSRWRMHALLREFVATKSPQAHADGAQRQGDWFLHRLPQQSDQEELAKAWEELRAEEGALASWLNGLPPAQAQSAVASGSVFARINGPWRIWLQAAERARELKDPFDRWAAASYLAAAVAASLGEHDLSLRLGQETRAQALAHGEDRIAALAAGRISDILMVRGDLDGALRMRQEEELPVYTKLGDIHSRAVTQGRIADILMELGDLDAALRIRQEEELPVYTKLGDIRSRAVAQAKIADILMERGDLDAALRIRQEEELPVFTKLGDIRSRAVTQGKIAIVYAHQREFPKAEKLIHEEVLPFLEQLGDRVQLVMVRALLAMIKRQLHKPAEAVDLLELALADAEALRLPVAAQIRQLLNR